MFVVAYLLSNLPFLERLSEVAADLAGLQNVHVSERLEPGLLQSCVKDSVGNTKIYLNVPKEVRENIELDWLNMDGKRQKLVNELEKINEMVSKESYKLKSTPATQQRNFKKV